ncbi:MAG: alpha/beta hydrolase [Paracoccaceae bacterium]
MRPEPGLRLSLARIGVALLALAAIAVAVVDLRAGIAPLEIAPFDTETARGTTPGTLYRLEGAPPGPVIVVAHGFAGSRQLMEPFSVTLARNGYLVVAFDFAGHGRNPVPLAGDVSSTDGATRNLLAEIDAVVAAADALAPDGTSVGLLGHSMATDIVIRRAVGRDDIAATVAVSTGPWTIEELVTPDAPRNLLLIAGDLEGGLKEPSLEAVRLSAGEPVSEGVTYGAPADGSARRAVWADGVEHVGVLYSRESLAEALAWFDGVFEREGVGYLEVRGPSILLLLAGIVAMGWPLAGLLPRLAEPPSRADKARWRRFLGRAALPAVLTPLLLWPVDTRFLPVLVADYLALHFLVYGAITGLLLWRDGLWREGPRAAPGPFVLATLATVAWTTGALGLALDSWVASFWPHAGRATLIAALAAGTLAYLVTDERLVRASSAPRGSAAASKLFMLVSLALAVALNPSELFFLAIITPVVVLFFLLYGLFAGWVYRATGHPGVAGVANALAFAWALGVTFPLLGG